MKEIETYFYSGFLDAGKTTYIQDNLFHDFFYRRGTTLILSFEEGEVSYDLAGLKERRCEVSFYDDSGDIASFCRREADRFKPDRIIIEDNVMIDNLPESLPDTFVLKAKTALISGETLPVYYDNMRPYFTRILQDAKLVVFNRTADKEDLLPYSTPFRLINPRASYLWESPMGYHEKAFGIPLTYDKSRNELTISDADYACFYLDSLEHPIDYQGKAIELTVQIQDPSAEPQGYVFGGRKVFTCCFADIQTLGFYLMDEANSAFEPYGWYRIRAIAGTEMIFNQKRLCLKVQQTEPIAAPKQELIGFRR